MFSRLLEGFIGGSLYIWNVGERSTAKNYYPHSRLSVISKVLAIIELLIT